MPLPTGHWEYSTGPRRINRRERWLIAGVLVVVGVALYLHFQNGQ